MKVHFFNCVGSSVQILRIFLDLEVFKVRHLECFEGRFECFFPKKKYVACMTPKLRVAADVKIGNLFGFLRYFNQPIFILTCTCADLISQGCFTSTQR